MLDIPALGESRAVVLDLSAAGSLPDIEAALPVGDGGAAAMDQQTASAALAAECPTVETPAAESGEAGGWTLPEEHVAIRELGSGKTAVAAVIKHFLKTQPVIAPIDVGAKTDLPAVRAAELLDGPMISPTGLIDQLRPGGRFGDTI